MDSNGHELRVLLISHDYPAFGAGEIETYAHQLHQAMRRSGVVDSTLLARIGFPSAREFPRHLGTPFGIFDEDDNEYWVFTEISDFDWLNLTGIRKSLYTSYLKEFLVSHEPDLVHVQSTLYVGLELLSLVKRVLPDATIVHSLHDYRPICHRDGVMVRTVNDEELCDHYSPRRCNECFPPISPGGFYLRKRFIEAQLANVDLFLAPSRFLMDRYVDWGVAPDKIRVSEPGRPVREQDAEPASRKRERFGFFGELTPHSGVIVLLKAMNALADIDSRLTLHGGSLEWQPFGFQDEFRQLAAKVGNVTFVDRYGESELPRLMEEVDWIVVPSLWWEGSCLAVQDAFRYAKPVICSGIGALAEKVGHDVNGLHFRRGDSESLAETMRRASESPDLWQRLHDGIPRVRSIEEDAASLIETYRQLHQSRTAVRA